MCLCWFWIVFVPTNFIEASWKAEHLVVRSSFWWPEAARSRNKTGPISLSKTEWQRWSCQRVVNIQIRELNSPHYCPAPPSSTSTVTHLETEISWIVPIHADPHAWAFGAAKKQPYMWAARACALHVAKCQSKRRIESVPVGWGPGGRAGRLVVFIAAMDGSPAIAQVARYPQGRIRTCRCALRCVCVGLDWIPRNGTIESHLPRQQHSASTRKLPVVAGCRCLFLFRQSGRRMWDPRDCRWGEPTGPAYAVVVVDNRIDKRVICSTSCAVLCACLNIYALLGSRTKTMRKRLGFFVQRKKLVYELWKTKFDLWDVTDVWNRRPVLFTGKFQRSWSCMEVNE
jgi:hypothetical protein